MIWKTIRLELASTRDFPGGSVSRGFLIRLPLIDDGSIDESTLAQSPQRATVRRFWSAEPDESGQVVRADDHLVLRSTGKPDRLVKALSFDLGEQVTVIDCDGSPLPFRVASIGRLQ